MGYKIGDLVRVNCPPSPAHNEETSILALNLEAHTNYGGSRDFVGHMVDIAKRSGRYGFCVFEPHELIPINDDDERKAASREIPEPILAIFKQPETVLS